MIPPIENEVRPGPIELHSPGFNPGFIERFFAVTDDLRQSGSIADIWLWDIAAVLAEFGYRMTITRSPEKQAAWEARSAS